jgi:hypothetical protein
MPSGPPQLAASSLQQLQGFLVLFGFLIRIHRQRAHQHRRPYGPQTHCRSVGDNGRKRKPVCEQRGPQPRRPGGWSSMQSRGATLVISVALAMSGLVVADSARAATTCSGQHDVCFNACLTFGFGKGRQDNPHPQPPDVCRRHCIGWKTECMTTGCWNGDLVKICGLGKR